MRLFSQNPIATLQKTWLHGTPGSKVLSVVAIVCAIAFSVIWILPVDFFLQRAGTVLLGLAGAIWLYLESVLSAKAEEEIEERLERAEKAVEDNPEKVRPLWDLARSRLELYFERNLSQIRSIFWVTVIVMVAGFILIGYGVVRAFNTGEFEAAILTTAAGVLTEFIAATLLIIYRSTMTQAKEYVATLERINAVGMSLQVLDSIPETDPEKNKTRSDLVLRILDSFTGNQV